MSKELHSVSIYRPFIIIAVIILAISSLVVLLARSVSGWEYREHERLDEYHHGSIVLLLELEDEINDARLRLWGERVATSSYPGSGPGDFHSHLFDIPVSEVLPHVAKHIVDFVRGIQDRQSRYAGTAFDPLVEDLQRQVKIVNEQLAGRTEPDLLSIETYDDIVRQLHAKSHQLRLMHASHYPVSLKDSYEAERHAFQLKAISGFLAILASLAVIYFMARRNERLVAERIDAEKQYEEILRGERDLSRAILDTAHVLIIVGNTEGVIEQFNARCEEVTLYKASEALGRPVTELLFPGEEEKIREILKEIAAGQGQDWYKLWLTTKSREKRLINWSSALIRDEAGNPSKIVGIGLDITERQIIEDQLRNSEQSLKRAQEISNTGNWVWNITNNSLEWSDQIYRILGIDKSPVSVTYDDFVRVTYPDDRERVGEAVAAAVADPDVIYDIQHRIIRPDGEIRYVQEQGDVVRDEEGTPIMMIGTVQDRTDQVMASEKINIQAQIIDQVHDSVVTTDLEETITSWNKGAERMFGYSGEEIIGKHVFTLCPESRHDFLENEIFDPLRREGSCDVEEMMLKKNGDIFCCHLSLSMRKDSNGNDIGMIGYLMDITERKKVESELKKTTQLLDSIVENVPNMIFLKNASDLSFEFFNRAGERLLGTKREELLGKNDYDLFPEEQADFFTAEDRKVLGQNDVVDIPQEPIDTPDGRRVLHTQKITLHDDRGVPRHLLGISEDITQRLEDEKALKQSVLDKEVLLKQLQYEKDYAESLVNAAPVIVLILGRDGLIQHVNPYFEKLTGYKLDEIQGKEWFATFLPERDQDNVRELFHKAVDGLSIEGNINPVVTRDGTERQIEWYARTMYDENGDVGGLISVGQDITERLESGKVLQQFKYTLDQTLDCVFMFDAETLCFTYVNEGAMRQVGYTYEEMLTLHSYDIKPEYNEQQFRELIQPLVDSSSTSITFETIHRHKDGRDIPVSISLQYIKPKSGQPHYIAIIRDISDRKRADNSIKKSLAEKEVLIRELHHRVKNILQVISSLINMQSRQIEDEKSKAAFMETRDRIRAVALIYEKLFGESNLSEIEVKRYIEYIASRLDSAYDASKRGIETTVNGDVMVLSMEKALPCGLIANELLTNIYKHAFEEGSPGKVSIDLKVSKDDGCSICIVDNGIGIDNQAISEDSFGLQIIRTLASQLGGKITVSGSEGTVAKLIFQA